MAAFLDAIHTFLVSPIGLMFLSALFGAVLTKYLPASADLLAKGGRRLIRRLSRTAASHEFRDTYLDWLVTENRELRLAGVVTVDETKKPTLEQVFVSLYIGKGQVAAGSRSDLSAELRAKQVVRTWRELQEALAMHGSKKLGQHASYTAWMRECRRRIRRRLHLPWTLDLTGTESSDISQWIDSNHELLDDEVLGELQVRKVLRSSSRVAILGAPGSGKTTLLQHLALTYARDRAGDTALRAHGILMERLGESTWRVPILLRLSSIAQQVEIARRAERTSTLLEIILALLPADLQTHAASKTFFQSELKKGNCIIFLDGLDEVPSQHDFQEVVSLIRGFMAAYRENRFVVTSRIVGWRGGISSDFDIFYVNDLTEAQVQIFVDTWYSAVEKNAVIGPLSEEGDAARRARERRALRRASELTATLRDNEGLRRLASNPMLLSIIALVHRSMATLPRERGKLYAECGRILLEQWDISRGVRVDDTHLKVEQKEAIMRRIAFALHRGEIGSAGGTREAATEDVLSIVRAILPDLGKPADEASHLLNMLIARSGLIAERQRGMLAFTHHTFQEYFAARYLAATKEAEHGAFLLDSSRLWSDWWREVILLYAGSVDDASVLLREIYTRDEGDLFLRHLRLACICLGEAVSCADADVRREILQSVFLVRNGYAVTGDSALTPAALAYLTAWANDVGWPGKAATSRVLKWTGANDLDALCSALADGLQRSDNNERHAALEVIPRLGKNVLLRIARETHAAALSIERSDVALAAEVIGRLALAQRSSEALAHLLDLDGAPEQVLGRVVRDIFDCGDVTQGEWQVLLRYLPRTTRLVGAIILENITMASGGTERQRAVVNGAIQAVANDDSAAGAIAMVLGRKLRIPVASHNVARRLVLAADTNALCRALVTSTIENDADLQSAVAAVLRDPQDAEDVTGSLDLVADAFDVLPLSLAADVAAYKRESVPEVRAAMARLLSKFSRDEHSARLLLRMTGSRNVVVRMNAICALPTLASSYEGARRRVLRAALRSRDAARRAAGFYAVAHMYDESLWGLLLDTYLGRKLSRAETVRQGQWYDFVCLRYAIEISAQMSRPMTLDVLTTLWDAAVQHVEYATAQTSPVESALGNGGLSVFEERHRRRRHLEHRRVQSRTNRVTLFDQSGDDHLARMKAVLRQLISAGSEQSLAHIATSIVSTNASVRDFALGVLADARLDPSDADTLLIPIKRALDDRSSHVRLSGTAAVRQIAPRMTLAVSAELVGRLADEDARVRDAAWDVLTKHYSVNLLSSRAHTPHQS